MNEAEWKEYRRQAEHDKDPPQVKTGDVLALLDERDKLRTTVKRLKARVVDLEAAWPTGEYPLP